MKFETKVDCTSYDQEISHVIWEITPEVIENLKAFGATAELVRKNHPDTIDNVAFKLPGDLEGVFVQDEDEDEDQPFIYGRLVEFQFADVFRITGYVDEGDAFSSDLLHVSELEKMVEVGDGVPR